MKEEEEEKEEKGRVREESGGSKRKGKRIEGWRGMSRGEREQDEGRRGRKGRRGKKEKRSFWTSMASSIPKSQHPVNHHFIRPSQV